MVLMCAAGFVGFIGGVLGVKKCQRGWNKDRPREAPPQPCGRRCQVINGYWPCEYDLRKNHLGDCTFLFHLGRGPEPTPVDRHGRELGRGADTDQDSVPHLCGGSDTDRQSRKREEQKEMMVIVGGYPPVSRHCKTWALIRRYDKTSS